MKTTTKKIIAGVGIAGSIALGAALNEPDPVYTKLEWDKPTKDSEWAEDVKKENFDIKSTGVLETMLESHTAKLAREELELKKYQECPQCIYYEFYEGFIADGWSENDAVAEATKQAQEATDNATWSVEKLRQSVERMQAELDLRAKGYVVEEKDATKNTDPDKIRKIND